MPRYSKLGYLILALSPFAGAYALDRPLRIADEGTIAKDWTPVGNAALATPAYPTVTGNRDDVCVALGFRINRDGTTSDFSLLKAWSAGSADAPPPDRELKPFLQAAAAAVSTWRFAATPDASANRVVYTAASIAFVSDPTHQGTEVSAHCRISNLKQFIADAQSQANKRGSLNRNQLERSQSQISYNQEALNAAAARGRRGQ